MKLVQLTLLLVLGLLALGPPVSGQFKAPGTPGTPGAKDSVIGKSFGDSRDHVKISVVSADKQVAPGGQTVIAIILNHDPGWHTWTNKGNIAEGMAEFDGAINTEIKFQQSPIQAHIDFAQWPHPHAVKADLGDGAKQYAVFTDRAVIFVPLTVNSSASPGPVALGFTISFQSCNDRECLAPVFDMKLSTPLEIVNQVAVTTSTTPSDVFKDFDASVFARIASGTTAAVPQPQSRSTTQGSNGTRSVTAAAPTFFGWPLPSATGGIGILLLILLSIVGGFILNLTPCVLPIIPIKIMTISQHAGTPGRSLILGMWMAAGVVAFWVGIGIPAALFTSAADPSRLFGIWWLTLSIGLLIGAMGVGIMGLFTIQLPAAVYSVNPKADTAFGSFLFGVMTAVLGLPCFGFVAGALLAGSATLPPAVVMLVFTSLGIGMAAPYLVLSAKPALVSRIPRTGPASELVKQVMGLLLVAAAMYFIGSGLIALISDRPYVARELHWWVATVCACMAGLWLILRTFQITTKSLPRVFFTIVGLLIGGVAALFTIDRTDKARTEWMAHAAGEQGDGFVTGAWNDFTPARFTKARQAGHIVVLDFTASWCLTCQALRSAVLDREPVHSALAQKDIVVFTVDLTSNGSPGWQLLQDLGKIGIPLLAIYGPASDSPWQANAYTSDEVIAALTDARQQKLTRK